MTYNMQPGYNIRPGHYVTPNKEVIEIFYLSGNSRPFARGKEGHYVPFVSDASRLTWASSKEIKDSAKQRKSLLEKMLGFKIKLNGGRRAELK